jgi:hypothetical protein
MFDLGSASPILQSDWIVFHMHPLTTSTTVRSISLHYPLLVAVAGPHHLYAVRRFGFGSRSLLPPAVSSVSEQTSTTPTISVASPVSIDWASVNRVVTYSSLILSDLQTACICTIALRCVSSAAGFRVQDRDCLKSARQHLI